MDKHFADARIELLFAAVLSRLPAADRRAITPRLAYVTDNPRLIPLDIAEQLDPCVVGLTYAASTSNAIALFGAALATKSDRAIRFVIAHELAHVRMCHVPTIEDVIEGHIPPGDVETHELQANMLASLWGFSYPNRSRTPP